jgi:hypothetical protein
MRTAMKVRVKWIENVAFVGETESSHAIVMDGAPEGVFARCIDASKIFQPVTCCVR